MTKPIPKPAFIAPKRGLSSEQVTYYTEISINRIYELIEQGKFPKPIEELLPKHVWDKADVDATFNDWSPYRKQRAKSE